MKKLINDPQDAMRESLAGFGEAHSDILKVNFDPVYVVRADAPVAGKVGIISGGGSGHEPMPRTRENVISPTPNSALAIGITRPSPMTERRWANQRAPRSAPHPEEVISVPSV